MTNFSEQPLTADRFPVEAQQLGQQFPELGRILDAHGMPDFRHRPPGFKTLVLIILEQQVSLLAAARAYGRIETGLGDLTSQQLANAGEPGLRELGITRQKARYLTVLASAVEQGSLNLASFGTKTDDEVFSELTRLPGIGPWTAKAYLMTALCRPDAWPPGDLALIKTIRTLLPDASPGLEKTGERWKPKRGVAARLLWHWYLSQ